MCDVVVTSDDITWEARYEHLRNAWLTQCRGWGLSLFVNRGMIAWLRASATPTQDVSPSTVSPSPSTGPIAIPSDCGSELTVVLVDILFHHPMETAS